MPETPAFSSTLLGRDRELQKARSFLNLAVESRSSCFVRIVSAPGYGKSAVLHDVLERAAADGWTALEARCFMGQQRTPGAALRRLVSDAVRAPSAALARYVSGLEVELTSSDTPAGLFERAFVRLIEALVIDRPCILAFDDAHWLDAQTLAALQNLLETTDAPLVVLFAEQAGHAERALAAASTLAIVLQPLKPEPALALVERSWPGVKPAVAASIVARADGIPFEVLALVEQAKADGAASPGDVATSASALLHETILALPPDDREFLHVCSLIREPIDLRILHRLFDDESKLENVIVRSSRYLTLENATLRFHNSAIAQAIRATLSTPLSLRRRILAAYASADSALPADYDRIAVLAADIGDTDAEYAALVSLGSISFAQEAYEAAIIAFERARSIGGPADADFVTFYNQYAISLRMAALARWKDAYHVLERAVEDGIARGVPAIGVLASALLYVVRLEYDRDVARATYRALRERLTRPVDRHEILAIGAYLAAEAADAAEFAAIRAERDTLAAPPSRNASTVFAFAEATLASRNGNFIEAASAVERARAGVDRQNSSHKFSVDSFASHIAFKEYGCARPTLRLDWLVEGEDGTVSRQPPPQVVVLDAIEQSAIADFAHGDWSRALAKIEETQLAKVAPSNLRSELLAIPAAIAALSGQSNGFATLIEDDLRLSYDRGLWHRALPIAFWWAAYLQTDRPREAERLIDPLRTRLKDTSGSTAFYFPIARVLYARRANDRDLLVRAIAERRPEFNNWDRAQETLAAGAALQARGEDGSLPLLNAASAMFDTLKASFFTAYANGMIGRATPSQQALLRALSVDASPTSGKPKSPRGQSAAQRKEPTLREREISDLVAEGLTNKEIAERFTISERTVETHLANLFAKLGVSTRTQLVRRMLAPA